MHKSMALVLIGVLVAAASPDNDAQNKDDIGTLHPSFPCIKSDTSLVARYVCSDQELTKIELTVAQAYFAFKQSLKSDLTGKLKSLSNARNDNMNQKCRNAEDPKTCIKGYYVRFRAMLIKTMYGAAKEEASRPFDQHMFLQEKLKEKGYLPESFKIDGVYGSETLKAIKAWQKANHRKQTGLLGDDDAALLAQ